MTAKQQLLNIASRLPDDCTWEQIQYELHVQEMLREADESEARGEIYTTEEAKELVASWIAK